MHRDSTAGSLDLPSVSAEKREQSIWNAGNTRKCLAENGADLKLIKKFQKAYH